MRRGSASIAANPVLIGAATTLVVIVAVFLAYNANSGLPFVPTYELKTRVPNAANLVKGNDVRIGGTRVGAVTDITPVPPGRLGQRASYAQARDHRQAAAGRLDRAHPPALGAGPQVRRDHARATSSQGFEDGATIPLHNATPQPVELDEVLNTFDDKTRAASQSNLTEFGNAFAGRGPDLNRAIEELNPLLINLVPVMQNLSDPRTRARALRHARSGGPRAIVAPVGRDPGGAVRQPRHHLPRPRQRRAPVPAGLDQRRAARARRGDQGLPAAAALPGQQRGPLPRAAPGRPRAVDRGAGPGRRAGDRHADAQALGGRSTSSLKPAFEALERFAEDPLVTLGVAGPQRAR